MRFLSRWVLLIAILAVMALSCRPTIGGQPPAPAAAFPEFTVKSLDGKESSLAKYRGKILILDLFATWCPPCRMEIPEFVHLQSKYPKQVAVVGLSFDQGSADPVKVFAKEMKINYDLYWGTEAIAQHVGLRGIPHTLVLDAQGRVFKSFIGFQDESVFERAIQTLLAGSAKTDPGKGQVRP